MSENFVDVVARLAPGQNPERLDLTARELDALMVRLAAVLNGLGDARAQHDILAYFSARTLAFLQGAKAEPQPMKLSPELLEWARSQFTEEEIVAGIHEIQTTGGLELRDFIHELEQVATPRE